MESRVGFPSLRLKGPYLAIATLGFGIAVYQIFDALRHLLNGQTGDLDAGATLELLNELTRHAAIDYETGEPVYQEDNS